MKKWARYYMKPRFNNQKDFYKKAEIYICAETNEWILKSYETEVCYFDSSFNFHRTWGGYSKTTMLHIKDFIYQYYSYYAEENFAIRKASDMNKKIWDSLIVESRCG